MLLLLFLIALFGGCGLVIGHALLTRLDPLQCFDRSGDRVILSIWIGVLVLSNCFLMISLFSSLSPLVTIPSVLLLLSISLWPLQNRSSLGRLFCRPAAGIILGISALALGVSVYCSQVIVWYDSSLYHFQAMKWLSEYGLVPGLALIHNRLGFISSWFALPASFNHGLLQGRIAALPGALCLLLLLVHGLLAFVRLAQQKGRSQDLFLATTSLLVTVVVLVWGLPNSPSPDFPVIVLIPMAAWAMLAISRWEEIRPGSETAYVMLIPLILAVGAVSIKLSALPLVVVAGCFYLFNGRAGIKKAAVAGSLVAVALAPVAVAGFVTSGCAFYPVSALCADLPWSLGAAAAESQSTLIREIARWSGPPPVHATSWNWILPWLRAEIVCSVLLVVSLMAIVDVLIPRVRTTHKQKGYVIALGISGIGLMLYGAPTWRFGLGYLVLLPALAIANHASEYKTMVKKLAGMKALGNFGYVGIAAAAIIALHVHMVPRPSYRLLDEALSKQLVTVDDHPHFNGLLPPRSWNLRYELEEGSGKTLVLKDDITQDKCGDIDYFRPEDPEKSDTCWDAPLPCSPGILKDIKSRHRVAGSGVGFEKIDID